MFICVRDICSVKESFSSCGLVVVVISWRWTSWWLGLPLCDSLVALWTLETDSESSCSRSLSHSPIPLPLPQATALIRRRKPLTSSGNLSSALGTLQCLTWLFTVYGLRTLFVFSGTYTGWVLSAQWLHVSASINYCLNIRRHIILAVPSIPGSNLVIVNAGQDNGRAEDSGRYMADDYVFLYILFGVSWSASLLT